MNPFSSFQKIYFIWPAKRMGGLLGEEGDGEGDGGQL